MFGETSPTFFQSGSIFFPNFIKTDTDGSRENKCQSGLFIGTLFSLEQNAKETLAQFLGHRVDTIEFVFISHSLIGFKRFKTRKNKSKLSINFARNIFCNAGTSCN